MFILLNWKLNDFYMQKFLWSCCGDDMRGTIFEYIQKCPTCLENCIGEEESSEEKINKQYNERT